MSAQLRPKWAIAFFRNMHPARGGRKPLVEQRVKSCRCRLHSDYRDFVSHSYIVLRAWRPAVASDARPGRVLAAERKVIS